jgi:urocanate hydratase
MIAKIPVLEDALEKRYNQRWIMEKISDLEECIARIKKARQEKKPVSIGFLVSGMVENATYSSREIL